MWFFSRRFTFFSARVTDRDSNILSTAIIPLISDIEIFVLMCNAACVKCGMFVYFLLNNIWKIRAGFKKIFFNL